jgi:hypothetical protein
MRLRTANGILALAIIAGGSSLQAAPTKPDGGANEVVRRPGEFASPDGKCRAALKISSSMGEFLVLTFDKQPNDEVDDITGMMWVSGDTLVYTTSPIYGIPGVWVYSCGSNRTTRIVKPRTFSKAYPDGADYFRLKAVSMAAPATVYFYYLPDVDVLDEKGIESPNFLFRVRLNGTGFSKAR